jgi:Icc-related predicted phosphoesterase
MKKIWHISDTHTFHKLLTVPKNIDIVIFSGDCSNPKDPYLNEPEVKDFIQWFKELPIKHKIFVAGNHDTSIEKGLIKKIDFTGYNIHYLENDYVNIDGIKIFGSPTQPTFGYDWSFQKKREKLDKHWSKIDDDVDIFVVHGPPKGILDLSYSRNHELEHCGCNALKRHILGRIKPKFCLFGHIHNVGDIINAGVLKLSGYPTVFSNGSVVTDNKFGKLSSNGNILIYE